MPFFPFVFFLFSLQTAPPGAGAEGPRTLPDYARSFQRGDYAGAATLAAERLKTQPRDVQQERRGVQNLLDPEANPLP